MARDWRRIGAHPALHCLLLALPFVAGAVWLHGLTQTMPVHQGFDENLHYAAALQFAQQLPFVDLHRSYSTSSGPLFYYLFGVFAHVFGAALYKLRIINVTISYATAVLFYLMLRYTLRTRPSASLALAAAVAVSPYLLGQTFVLLTDNLMYLWLVIALDGLARYMRRPNTASIVTVSAATALALLTRQFAVWLVPVALLAVWLAEKNPKRRAAHSAIVAASCAPLALVFVAWGGIIEPGSGFMLAQNSSRVPYLLQALAVVGLYALAIIPMDRLAGFGRALRKPPLWFAGLAVLLALELDHIAQQPFRFGYLSMAAAAYPDIAGTSVLYFLLAPAGAMFLLWALRAYRDEPFKRLVVIALVLVSGITLVSAIYYQRYVDVPTLMLMSMLASGRERVRRADFVRWWLLVATFLTLLYAFVFLLPRPQILPVRTSLPL